MSIIIKRHYVPNDSQNQLSPLQTALLEQPASVRIADAPTGAGKSYAFQQAMLAHQARVLFIVPTRRLAQNLIAELTENLKKMHWSDEQIQKKTAIWSSDETKKLQEQGIKEIGALRVRAVYELNSQEGGEMIVAIPEVVSNILLRRYAREGQSDTGIFDFLSCFEHIVFDEFHTITARGFGLAAVFAKLAAEYRPCRAQVSFLSATPVDIEPILAQFGVPAEQMVSLQETITDSGRAVHGDVVLSFEDQPTLATLLAAHLDVVRAELEQQRQVVMIYDALIDLQQQIPELERLVQQMGILPEQCLLLNSIDDSRPEVKDPSGQFAVGRTLNPKAFKLLIATSCIEMGVTFKANVLLMEPGREPLNFLQRYGRAARGNVDGQVIVRVDEGIRKQRPWLRELLSWSQRYQGQTIDIQTLTQQLTRHTAVAELKKQYLADKPAYFGKLPQRAVYTAGLYWSALMKHRSYQGHRLEHLKQHLPNQAKTIFALLNKVKIMQDDRQFGDAAKTWCERFEAEARILRDIGRSIRVIEPNGESVNPRILWLRRMVPAVLEQGRWMTGDDGQEEIHINRYLQSYSEEAKRTYVPEQVKVLFPHTCNVALLKVDYELVDNWCRSLREASGPESIAWDDYPEAMKAAEELVRKTGLVVSDDFDTELDAEVGVW